MRKEDDASAFKRRSLNAIQRRRKLKRITFIALVIIALIMMMAVIAAYMLD